MSRASPAPLRPSRPCQPETARLAREHPLGWRLWSSGHHRAHSVSRSPTGPHPPPHSPSLRRLPSSLVPRSSVQATPRPSGSLTGPRPRPAGPHRIVSASATEQPDPVGRLREDLVALYADPSFRENCLIDPVAMVPLLCG